MMIDFDYNHIDLGTKGDRAFSIVEIVVVISVLSTLAAISIPNVLKSLKLSRLDEAKILMDSYAAECLQEYRLGKELDNILPSTISDKKLEVLGYKKETSSNCSKLSIVPIDSNEELLFQFDFRIGKESGQLIKTALTPNNSSSIQSCQLWAGDLCTTDNSKKTIWDNLFKLEAEKAKCESDFFDWRSTLPSGSKNRWDDSNNTCSKETWVYKNFIAETQSEYDKIKSSEECLVAKKNYSTYTGAKYIPECKNTFYFYMGADLLTEDRLKIKLIEDEEISCKVKQEERRSSSPNGKYSGESLAGSCGNFYWICEKKILTSLEQWKQSNCYSP